MNVRPATRVTRGKDRGKPDLAAAIGLLDAAQVVLAGNAFGVEGVSAFPVAMPHINCTTSQGCFVGVVTDGHRDAERHTFGLGRAGSEARSHVASYDAGLVQHVCTIGTVARKRAAGLLGKLAVRGIASLRTIWQSATTAAGRA